MRREDFLEVLVGQQLVLEGIGEVVLSSLEKGMSQHDIGFGKLRGLTLTTTYTPLVLWYAFIR
jgi:hypothetical protein